LGIGANTATFSVVYAVLLKPLAYPHSDRLVFLFEHQPAIKDSLRPWRYADFEELQQRAQSFASVEGSARHQLTLTGWGDPVLVDTTVVTGDYFSTLGTEPIAGRSLSPDDCQPGAAPTVVLSEPVWRTIFGGDPGVIGRTIRLDRKPFTVVGIMPGSFRSALVASQHGELWIAVRQDPLFSQWIPQPKLHWLPLVARLKPGVSIMQARAEMTAFAADLGREFPAVESGWTIGIEPLRQTIVGDSRFALLVLLGAVGLVLLIACANIANLLLARATSRSREIAVRMALGAGRARIVRQLLSESVVLGALGGIAGLLLAWWGVHALAAVLPADVPRVNEIRVDNAVLAFALALSIVASCAFGLAPAFLSANASFASGLGEGGRSGESGRSRRARNVLAIGEIAIAMSLLVVAGLLLRSFSKLMAVNPGFAVERVIKATISLPRFEYSTPQQWADFAADLLSRVQAEPGLRDAALVIPAPMADGVVLLNFEIAGRPAPSTETRSGHFAAASPAYFRTMGIPLIAGRAFDEHDVLATSRVAIVSRAFVRRYFRNENPIGLRLRFGMPPDGGTAREIVGVVGDIRDDNPGEDPAPMMYAPYAQAPFAGAGLVIKTSENIGVVSAVVRRDVAAIDKNLPVDVVETMAQIVDASTAQPRFRTLFLSLFAAIALVLAATGIFGVISYTVSCRTQEIGIRQAVGASRAAILWMITRETLALVALGLACGLPCALGASRLVEHMLFNVRTDDPLTLAAVAIGLAMVAVLAGFVPARRAMRVDPMVALRHQ
ncbi:MAG TPA: ABC transporter permease, partial [Bryobacteraceae bacterium]|nr:ABC transporter permease [Bryobacteraceae bacterium]